MPAVLSRELLSETCYQQNWDKQSVIIIISVGRFHKNEKILPKQSFQLNNMLRQELAKHEMLEEYDITHKNFIIKANKQK